MVGVSLINFSICSAPSFHLKFIVLSSALMQTILFNIEKHFSIGANSGQYGGIK